MPAVTRPEDMNDAFLAGVNAADLDGLLELYEPDAIVRVDAEQTFRGLDEIRAALSNLVAEPGKLVGKNVYCLQQGDLALLRADWALVGEDGTRLHEARTAEIVRRGADGRWRYVIDHAAGASLPPEV